MLITNYKELKEYLKDTSITISANSENAKVVYLDNTKVTLPAKVIVINNSFVLCKSVWN